MKELVVDTNGSINKYILLKDNKLDDLIIEDNKKKSLVGNIYCGRVLNIVNKNFAFINIGLEKNAFLDLSDTKEELLVTEVNGKRKLNIKQGDCIIVQVLKDAVDEKGVAVTSQINVKGNYLAVYKALNNQVGVSKKIVSKNKRTELKELGSKLINNDYSVVFRTESENISEDIIEKEYLKLKKELETLLEKGKYLKPPCLVVNEKNGIVKTINEIKTDDTNIIICNNKEVFDEIQNEFEDVEIKIFEDEEYIKFITTFENQIEKLFNKNVWLKSGGFIVIEETEACVVIDVNTSKSVKSKKHNEIALKTNKEAVVEIVKQIKLRNLSGMIIIDFIDMRSSSQKNQLIKFTKELLKEDKTKTFVIGITELGLMQITRKKTRSSISKTLRHKCATCNGLGTVPRYEIVVSRIFKEVFSLIIYTIYNDITICANEKIIDEIKKNNLEIFKNLELTYNVNIKYKSVQTGKVDYFEIEKNKIDNKI